MSSRIRAADGNQPPALRVAHLVDAFYPQALVVAEAGVGAGPFPAVARAGRFAVRVATAVHPAAQRQAAGHRPRPTVRRLPRWRERYLEADSPLRQRRLAPALLVCRPAR